MAGQVVRGELRGNPAPAEGQAGADHRDDGVGAPEGAQHVRQQAGDAKTDEHQRDRELLGVRGAPRRRGQTSADHAHDDREHRDVLVASGVLAQHPLGQEHQDQQAGRERRLHDNQGGQHEGDDLQREAEDREPRAEQPARAPDQAPGEREAQMLLVRRLLRVHRL
jgi:hypothetical protein